MIDTRVPSQAKLADLDLVRDAMLAVQHAHLREGTYILFRQHKEYHQLFDTVALRPDPDVLLYTRDLNHMGLGMAVGDDSTDAVRDHAFRGMKYVNGDPDEIAYEMQCQRLDVSVDDEMRPSRLAERFWRARDPMWIQYNYPETLADRFDIIRQAQEEMRTKGRVEIEAALEPITSTLNRDAEAWQSELATYAASIESDLRDSLHPPDHGRSTASAVATGAASRVVDLHDGEEEEEEVELERPRRRVEPAAAGSGEEESKGPDPAADRPAGPDAAGEMTSPPGANGAAAPATMIVEPAGGDEWMEWL